MCSHKNIHLCVFLQYGCAVNQGYVSLFQFHNAEGFLVGSSLLADARPRIQFAQEVLGVQRWHARSAVWQSCRAEGERIALESQDKPMVLMEIAVSCVASGLVLRRPTGLCKMYGSGMCGRLDCEEFSSF